MNLTRCSGGQLGAASITTGQRDSFEIFGINDHIANCVIVERQATCSPVGIEDLKRNSMEDSLPNFPILYEDVYMGGTVYNYTFRNPINPTMLLGTYSLEYVFNG